MPGQFKQYHCGRINEKNPAQEDSPKELRGLLLVALAPKRAEKDETDCHHEQDRLIANVGCYRHPAHPLQQQRIAAMTDPKHDEKARKEKPDLILLDLMLPKITGFEVCRMLKFDDNYKNIPIIVLSALDQQGEREKAIQNGADAYFIKPFELELLIVKIRNLLK